MAKKLQRNFIGFEQDKEYIKLAKKRLKNTQQLEDHVVKIEKSRKDLPKVPFGELVEQGIIPPGAVLTCLLYTSPSPRDATLSRMPSSA